MFSASTPLYLFGRIARLVERQPNYAGRATMVAMQVIALVYMTIVFCIGIYWEKEILNIDEFQFIGGDFIFWGEIPLDKCSLAKVSS